MSYFSGNVTAILTSSANNRTAKVLTGTAINQTTDVGTVGAGKVWRILSLDFSVSSTNTTDTLCTVVVAGVTALRKRSVSLTTNPSGSSSSLNWDYAAAPVLAATEKVQVISGAAGVNAECGISYVEESA